MKVLSLALSSFILISAASCGCCNNNVKPGGNTPFVSQSLGGSFEYPSDWTAPVEDAKSVNTVSPGGVSAFYVFLNSGLSVEEITGMSVKSLSVKASTPEKESVKSVDQMLIDPEKLSKMGADSGYSPGYFFLASGERYYAGFFLMKKGDNLYIVHTITQADKMDTYAPIGDKVFDSLKIVK